MSLASMIPVLLMNPEESMARKKTHHRRTNHHRRSRNPGNPRRRRHTMHHGRRRRRNPTHKLPTKDLLLAGLGGLAVAGIEFATDGTTAITNGWQAALLAGIGVVGGGLLSLVSPPIGLGVFATGVGVGAYKGGSILLASPSSSAKTSGSGTQGMGALAAELSAVRAELGAVRADLGLPPARRAAMTDRFVQAELAGARR